MYAANPENVKAKNKAWRDANPEKVKASTAKWRAANPEKAKKWRAANPEKAKKWKRSNPEKVKELNSAQVERLSSNYIASLLKLPVALIPQSLIDLKRVQVQITRKIKELKK